MSQQEARFLESRQARAAAQRPRRQKSHHEELHQFWTSLRHDLSQWQGRLETLQKEIPPKTASERSQCRDTLDRLLEELYTLRRNCLSSTEVPELPPADVRLLHQEFTTLATQLEQVKEKLLPQTKFTFKKYRAAMKQQQASQQDDACFPQQEEVVSKTMVSNSDLSTIVGNAIQNYNNATLVLYSNGSLVIQKSDEEDNISQESEQQSSLLLLQNLHHCQVTINGNYKALHIQNVTNSAIHVSEAIDGAIHMTACKELKLYATCHQLRIHESNALECHVAVGSGPILEDCSNVVFYASNPHDLVYETKDFNWLRNGVPSPNFCIKQQKMDVKRDGKEKNDSSQGNESKIGRNDINKMVSSGNEVNSEVPAISAETQPDDDDDDDEL